ncbi:hypothetical protein CPB86DRAFT_783544 [Serendipita vermifera]|nr:hypothetical protein CPB86DRAFT_783544 [Serendipita vermifera]
MIPYTIALDDIPVKLTFHHHLCPAGKFGTVTLMEPARKAQSARLSYSLEYTASTNSHLTIFTPTTIWYASSGFVDGEFHVRDATWRSSILLGLASCSLLL